MAHLTVYCLGCMAYLFGSAYGAGEHTTLAAYYACIHQVVQFVSPMSHSVRLCRSPAASPASTPRAVPTAAAAA